MDKDDMSNDWSGLKRESPRADRVMQKIRALPKLGDKVRGVWFRTDNTWTKLPMLAQCVSEPHEKPDGRWGVKWWEPGELEVMRTFTAYSEARAFVDEILKLR